MCDQDHFENDRTEYERLGKVTRKQFGMMLGAGVALLLSDKLSVEQRRAAGLTLFLIGAVTTVPLVMEVIGNRRSDPTSARGDIEKRNYSLPPLAERDLATSFE